VSLAEARERATELRREVAGGSNPIERKRREREEATTKAFSALAERYLTEHARRFKRSWATDERNLRLHVLPVWKNRRYDEIERRDVIALSERLISQGKPILANRVQALISSMFSFAVDADLLRANPCTRLRKRSQERVRRRVLSDDELRLFWERIIASPVSKQLGLALRLILLTGVRAGEMAGARREEFRNSMMRTGRRGSSRLSAPRMDEGISCRCRSWHAPRCWKS
jgi:integrase